MLSNVCNHSCELNVVVVVEKLRQRHCPVEPGIEDFHVLRVVSGNEVVHGRNVASCFDGDGLAQLDGEGLQRSSFRAYLACHDGSDGVDEPSVVAQAVELLRGVVDLEFAVVFYEGCAS